MPTYEYACPCGHRFEKVRAVSARASATCPTCRRRARKIISRPAGIHFKGPGFYVNDYPKDNREG